MGRPSEFTQEIADAICEQLIDGRSLRSICLADDMPNAGTVCRWLGNNAEFREQYERARDAQADTLADEMLDIADDATNDWMARKDVDEQGFGWQINGEHVQRSKVRIDTRKWIAAKLKPKKYGDKTLIGSDPDNPLPAGIDVKLIAPPLKLLTHNDDAQGD